MVSDVLRVLGGVVREELDGDWRVLRYPDDVLMFFRRSEVYSSAIRFGFRLAVKDQRVHIAAERHDSRASGQLFVASDEFDLASPGSVDGLVGFVRDTVENWGSCCVGE